MTLSPRDRRTAALQSWITAEGGVVHSTIAHARGFSPHDVVCALRTGSVERVRRSWLALPGADSALLTAASVSGRVTCVTQARALGLWVSPQLTADAPHIAVPHSASRLADTGLTLHWARAPIAVSRTALVDPVINVLFQAARCLPRIDALAVWESALRKRLVVADMLARVQWHSPRAAELAGAASLLSDSGIETVFAAGMRALGLTVEQQVWIDGHPVDARIGKWLVVQLDGFAHHQAADRRRDLRTDARLVLLGYTVLRFDYQQVLFDWAYVEATVLTAIAQGLHKAC